MTASNHAVMGGLIAALLPDPYVAVPLALASHFVLDSLPHFGTKSLSAFYKVYGTDFVVATIMFLLLFIIQPKHWILIAICAFVAMSPDIMWAPNALRTYNRQPRKKLNLIMKFHKNIQWGERSWGLAVEIPWFVIFSTIFVLVER